MKEFKYEHGTYMLYLTERPYRPEKLRNLIKFAVECKKKGFPSNKLSVLYQSLLQGKDQATLDYLKMIQRLKEAPKEVFNNMKSELEIIPWRKKKNAFHEFTTPFMDFVEIYEFVTVDVKTEESVL